MAISEKIELLGKGLYDDIPDQLTLKNIPTASELDYVGAEDFDEVMLNKILPSAVEEKIDFRKLLEIDYQWVCRGLRLLNFGPYFTTGAILCDKCGQSYGEYKVDLRAIDCKPLPERFINKIVISRDEFIDFRGSVEIKLPTIQQILNAYKDKQFQTPSGRINREFARICYMITAIDGDDKLTPIDIRMKIQKEFSSADYVILKETISNLTDYGIRAGGRTRCPKCGSDGAAFVAFVDERFFRPTLDDLREWKRDKSKRSN